MLPQPIVRDCLVNNENLVMNFYQEIKGDNETTEYNLNPKELSITKPHGVQQHSVHMSAMKNIKLKE